MRNKGKQPRMSAGRRLLMIAIGVVVVALALGFSIRELSKKPVLRITEVLSSNRGLLPDADGEYHDIIEIYNDGEIRVNLKSYYLSDNDNKPLRWRFPSVVLEPGEYLYVYASGKNAVQETDGILHTNFSIAAEGEAVVLSDPRGVLVDRVEPFVGLDNISYAYIDAIEGWAYLALATPGAANTGSYALNPAELQPANTWVMLSEYMAQNNSVMPDEDGAFHDWIELYNPNESTVSLAGWSLTDNENNLKKWVFPGGMSITPGGCLTIYMSGLDQPGHASFKLSSRDGKLLLVDPNGRTADTITMVDTPLEVSYGRLPNGTEGYFQTPTPGEPNAAEPVADLSMIEWDAPLVRISEYMSTNNIVSPDAEGDFNDLLELHNYGDTAVNLSGFFLSDRESEPDKWEFSDGTILQPGQRLVLQLSGKKLDGHVGFSLGKDDDCLMLSDRNGRIVDKALLVFPQDHVSYGRDEAGPETWLYYPRPTFGGPNDTPGFAELSGVDTLAWRGLYVSEVSHSNWIELGNASGESIDMTGWHISDDSGNLTAMALPEKTLASGSFLKLDLSFGISNRSETVYLTDESGTLRDSMDTGALKLGVTSGRAGNSAARVYFTEATPGEGNVKPTFLGYAGEITASIDDGYVTAGTAVTLTASYGGTIYYTLDGTEPTKSSAVYTAPIVITKSTPLRAVVVRDGYLPGRGLVRTYLVEEKHTLPVVMLTTAPDNLFSHSRGLFADGPGWTSEFPHQGANYWKDWERDVHFAYYDENGVLQVEADAGIKVFGQYSRAIDQKSVQIHFRKDYGINRIAYPFFEDNEVTEYGSLLLRTSGQDWNNTKLKDAYMAQAIKDEMELDYMDSRPVIVYINGEYWGLYNLREKINEDYMETHYGVDGDNVDIIKANKNAVAGSNKEYLDFIDSLDDIDIKSDAGYQYIVDSMDLTNWMDYWIMESFYCNTDSGNIKCWKEKGEDGKWRWIMFDLDWGMNLSTADPSRYPSYAQLCRFLDPKGHGISNAFSTKIARTIMKNERIRNAFVDRYNYHLENTFNYDRMTAILDKMAAEIRPEMQRQIERWGGIGSLERWEKNIENMKTFLQKRPDQIREQLKVAINYR